MIMQQQLLGGTLFAAAAVFLAVTGGFEIITIAAVVLCSVCAALSAKKPTWAIFGGAALISGSLLLQTIYSYRCADCLKADAIILCAVISMTILEEGGYVKVARVLAGGMEAIMVSVFIMASPPLKQSESLSTFQDPKFDRYISVSDGKADLKLDTQEKPVLLFSPECGACQKAIEILISEDPRGERWTAVQAGGVEQDGRKYLEGKGYKGKITYTIKDYAGAVPAFIFTRSGKTTLTRNADEMASLVGQGQ